MFCFFFHLLRYIQTEKFYWSLITSSQLHRWTLFKNIQQLKSSKSKKNQLFEKISNLKQQKKLRISSKTNKKYSPLPTIQKERYWFLSIWFFSPFDIASSYKQKTTATATTTKWKLSNQQKNLFSWNAVQSTAVIKK